MKMRSTSLASPIPWVRDTGRRRLQPATLKTWPIRLRRDALLEYHPCLKANSSVSEQH